MTSSATPLQKNSSAQNLALVAVFAALLAVFALIPGIPIGPAAVPITFQMIAIFLTGLILGGKRGLLAICLYIAVGLIGVPVFMGGGGGIGVLARPSAGYILGWIPCIFIIGTLSYIFLKKFEMGAKQFAFQFLAITAGYLVLTLCGIAGMMINAGLSFEVAAAAALSYIPLDILKAAVAIVIALAVHKAFPALRRS